MRLTRRKLRKMILLETATQLNEKQGDLDPYTAADVRKTLKNLRVTGYTMLGTNDKNTPGLIVYVDEESAPNLKKAVDTLHKANYDAKLLDAQETAGLDIDGGSAGIKRINGRRLSSDVDRAKKIFLNQFKKAKDTDKAKVIFVDLAGSGAEFDPEGFGA